jgi:RimJ/RimL family protein N-acetyltransferase
MGETSIPVLHADRVTLRPWLEGDAARLHDAFGDPVAMRFWDAPPARDVAERLGFRQEGLLRDRMFVAGEARSVLMYALLQPEWSASR